NVVKSCRPVEGRYEQVLKPAPDAEDSRRFDMDRFVAQRKLDGADVLLIDDTWTSGVHAQSAALTLKSAGAGRVGLVVVGRHFQPEWVVDGRTSADIFAGLPKPFDYGRCALCSA